MFLVGFFKTAAASVKALVPGESPTTDTKTDASGDADALALDASGDVSRDDAHHLDAASAEQDTPQPEVSEAGSDQRDEVTAEMMDDPLDDPLGGTLFETLRLDSHALDSDRADDDPAAGHLGADRLIDIDAAIAAPVPDWTDTAHLVFGGDGVEAAVPGAGEDVFAIGDYTGSAVVPTITDFDPALDELQLVYDASTVDDPTVTTRVEGDVLALELCGAVVARLEGISSIDPALIRLIPITA
jgi:hypothetical protein